MPTQDASSSSSPDEPRPLLPYLDFFALPEERIRQLQEILEQETGRPWKPLDVRLRGIELLELTAQLVDPAGWEHWRKHPPFAVVPEPAFEPLPIPQAFPIKLEADHPREVEKALRILEDELRFVKRRPTHWRWALVALYDALGHSLAMRLPANVLPYSGLGQLTRLFDAVAAEMPELPQVRASVELVDELRTRYITWGVTRWPLDLKALSEVVEDCLRVISRLDEGPAPAVMKVPGRTDD